MLPLRMNKRASVIVSGLGVVGLACLAACATSVQHVERATGDDGGVTGDDDGGAPPDDSNTPHALGVISLGEAHASGSGTSEPIVSATFLPDFKLGDKLATKCVSGTKDIAGCKVTQVTSSSSVTCKSGCGSEEVCTLDPDTCTGKCVATCTDSCAADEECYVGSSGTASCRTKKTWDAGALAFSGLTSPMTLFPPYAVKPTGSGAPFLAKDQIRVQASGASDSGFDQFDETFTATTFMETSPALSKLSKSDLFGKGDVTIGWKPGADTVTITISGQGGSASCTADDTKGSYAISRDVLDAVMTSPSSGSTTATGGVSITVARARDEIKKGKTTKGVDADGNPLPEGWLQLETMSSESATFTACTSGYAWCNNACVDVYSDSRNCGSCGHACPSGYYCSSGSCY